MAGADAQMQSILTALLVAGAAATCRLDGPLDLGRPMSSNLLRISNVVPFQLGTLKHGTYFGARYAHNDFSTGEHVGTHMDAPFHFNENGWKIEQIPLRKLIANGVFLNVSAEVAGNASFRLQPSHIDAWVERNGPFPNNAMVLISYGWAQLYHNHTLYSGTNTTDITSFNYPGITSEAVDRLTQIDQVVGFGIDTPSVDPPNSAYAHQTMALKNIYFLEQVNLDQPCLPEKGFKVYSLPINIAGGTGGPTRVIAVPDGAA